MPSAGGFDRSISGRSTWCSDITPSILTNHEACALPEPATEAHWRGRAASHGVQAQPARRKSTSPMSNPYEMQDPRTQYPQPKFSHQPQSVPGIAGEMTPRPDHGEESYKGNGRLPNRK